MSDVSEECEDVSLENKNPTLMMWGIIIIIFYYRFTTLYYG